MRHGVEVSDGVEHQDGDGTVEKAQRVDRLVGHGEVVVVEDTLAVSVTDIIKSNIDCELSVAGTYCWKTISSLQVTLHGT